MQAARVLKSVWAGTVLALALMGAAVHAKPQSAEGGQSSSKAKKKSVKSANRGQMKILPGSAETTKERSDRLKRECKGRVNAGACAGFTG